MDLPELTVAVLLLFLEPGDGLGHPCDGLGQRGEEAARLRVAQFVVPAGVASAVGGLTTHDDIGAVGRELYAAHAAAVGEVVEHIGVATVEGGSHGVIGVDGDLDGVGGTGLGEVLDGEDMMGGSQGEGAVALLLVDEQLGALGALDLDLTLEVAGVVDIEGEHAHGTAVGEGGQYGLGELARDRGREGDGLQQRLVVELLACHIDGVGAYGHLYGMGAGDIKTVDLLGNSG